MSVRIEYEDSPIKEIIAGCTRLGLIVIRKSARADRDVFIPSGESVHLTLDEFEEVCEAGLKMVKQMRVSNA